MDTPMYKALPDVTLEDLIDRVADINTRAKGPAHVAQDTLIIEECSELVKELCKLRRNIGDPDRIIEECCDVLCTIYVYFKILHVRKGDVDEIMMRKLLRTVGRYGKL